jgi:hypothetical protein
MLELFLDPATYAVYVDASLYRDFVSDVNEMELAERPTRPMPRVACPESFFRSKIAGVPEWVVYSSDWKELLVVVDASPGLSPEKDDDADDKRAAWPQWGFIETGGDVAVYNESRRQFVPTGSHKHMRDEVVAKIFTSAKILTSSDIPNGFPHNFTIQPVLATRTTPLARWLLHGTMSPVYEMFRPS